MQRTSLFRRAWSWLMRSLHQLALHTYGIKKLLPIDLKDRVKLWLLWKSYQGPMTNPSNSLANAKGREGVNLFGFLERSTGLGEGARANVRALRGTGILVEPIAFTEEELAHFRIPESMLNPGLFKFNLWHVNAAEAAFALRSFGPHVFFEKFNIGYWAWELERFPPDWDSAFRYFDEIWVPSEFVRKSIAARANIPVIRMPHPVEVQPSTQNYRAHFGIPVDRPVFLCMFDMLSSAERKNPWGAVHAFKAACDGKRRAFLTVKVGSSNRNAAAMDLLRKELEGLETLIIDRDLPREEAVGLISACDGYISLHRGEGFGLINAEAMALGKAVVSTGYSGNMDFMNEQNSYPVKYKMIEIERKIGPYPKGYLWADPDIGDAAMKLQQIMDDPAAARKVGALAAEHIRTHYSTAAVGKLLRARLEELGLPAQTI